jgi:hypothetical protein
MEKSAEESISTPNQTPTSTDNLLNVSLLFSFHIDNNHPAFYYRGVGRNTKILLVCLAIIGLLDLFIIGAAVFNRTHSGQSSKTQPSSQNVSISGYILPDTTIAGEGYFVPSTDKSTVEFVGKLIAVSNTNGIVSVQGETRTKAGNTIKQTFLIFSSQDNVPVHLIKQTTGDFFTFSKTTHSFDLRDVNQIAAQVSGEKDKLAIFTLNLSFPTVPTPSQIPHLPDAALPANILKKYLPCNSQFYQVLVSGDVSSLTCTPYVGQIRVYDP